MADHAQPNPFFPPSQGQYRPVPSSAHDARAGGSSATLYGGEGGGAYADAGHKPEREVLMSSSVPHSVPQRHFDDEHGVDSAGHPASGRLVILRAVQLGLQSVVFVCLCVASTSPFVSLYSGFAWYWWTFVSTFLINIHIALFNGLPSYRGRVIAVFARGSGAAMFMWGPVVYDAIAFIQWISASGAISTVALFCTSVAPVGCVGVSMAAVAGFLVWISYGAALVIQYVERRGRSKGGFGAMGMGVGAGDFARTVLPLGGEKGWDRDLFSCFDDPALCLVAWFVPCVTHGQIMEEDGQGTCLESGVIFGILGMLGLSPCLACFRRRRVREKRGIPGDNMTDFCTVCWCHPCAALQELNEVTKYPVAESLSSHSFIQFTVTPPSPLPPPSPVTAGPSHDSPVYSAPPVYAYAAPHQPQPKSSAPPPLPTDLPGYVPRGGK